MTNTLVSVIITVYNSDKYLFQSLLSIINQTYTNIEIILVNDGSTDNTHFIIQKFLKIDERIIYINRKQNKGLVFSLNEALSISKGFYIARMDSDDISESTRLEKQIQFLVNNPNVYMIGSAYRVINDKSQFIKFAFHPKDPLTLFLSMSFNTYFCHPSIVFKKEILTTIGFYQYVQAEDYDLFSRIVLNFPSANLLDPLINYRNHNENRSNEKSISIFESRLKISSNYFSFLGLDIEASFLKRLVSNSDKREIFTFSELVYIWKIYYKIFTKACIKYKLKVLFHFDIFLKFYYCFFSHAIKYRIKKILTNA